MDSNKTVIEHFIAKHPFSAAKKLEVLEDSEVAEFVNELSLAKAGKLLSLMNFAKASTCFLALPVKKKIEIMELGEEAWVESILRLMEEGTKEDLLSKLPNSKSIKLRRRLEQAPNTVGVFMFPAATLGRTMTSKTALEVIKRNKAYFDSEIFVVNLEGILEGLVTLKSLILSEPSDTMEELMISNPPKFLSDTPVKNILDHPAWLDYDSIPIIDNDERLLGALSYTSAKELRFVSSKPQTKEIIKTGAALGELYLVGISGILQIVRK